MNTYTIYTDEDFSGVAPANMRWVASFSPLDEGKAASSGYGATERAAMIDLIYNHDLPEVSK